MTREKYEKTARQRVIQIEIKELKGDDLIEFDPDHLLRLGYDEQIVRAFMENQNEELRRSLKKKQIDVENLNEEIPKLKKMNEEYEKEVIETCAAFSSLELKHQIPQADIERYSFDARAKYEHNKEKVKEVSINGTEKLRQEILDSNTSSASSAGLSIVSVSSMEN